jgi:hypothetical protein
MSQYSVLVALVFAYGKCKLTDVDHCVLNANLAAGIWTCFMYHNGWLSMSVAHRVCKPSLWGKQQSSFAEIKLASGLIRTDWDDVCDVRIVTHKLFSVSTSYHISLFKKEQIILDFRRIVMCSYHGRNIVECSVSVFIDTETSIFC